MEKTKLRVSNNFLLSPHRSDLLVHKRRRKNSSIALDYYTHITIKNASSLPYPTAYRLYPLGPCFQQGLAETTMTLSVAGRRPISIFVTNCIPANALVHKSSQDRLHHIAAASASR